MKRQRRGRRSAKRKIGKPQRIAIVIRYLRHGGKFFQRRS
jgi:hypothetical protein